MSMFEEYGAFNFKIHHKLLTFNKLCLIFKILDYVNMNFQFSHHENRPI